MHKTQSWKPAWYGNCGQSPGGLKLFLVSMRVRLGKVAAPVGISVGQVWEQVGLN